MQVCSEWVMPSKGPSYTYQLRGKHSKYVSTAQNKQHVKNSLKLQWNNKIKDDHGPRTCIRS